MAVEAEVQEPQEVAEVLAERVEMAPCACGRVVRDQVSDPANDDTLLVVDKDSPYEAAAFHSAGRGLDNKPSLHPLNGLGGVRPACLHDQACRWNDADALTQGVAPAVVRSNRQRQPCSGSARMGCYGRAQMGSPGTHMDRSAACEPMPCPCLGRRGWADTRTSCLERTQTLR